MCKLQQNSFPQGVQYSIKVYFKLMFSALGRKGPLNVNLTCMSRRMWLNLPTPFSRRGHQEQGSVRSVAWALNKQGVHLWPHPDICVLPLDPKWMRLFYYARILSFLIFSLFCVLKSQKTFCCCVVYVSYWSAIASCFFGMDLHSCSDDLTERNFWAWFPVLDVWV